MIELDMSPSAETRLRLRNQLRVELSAHQYAIDMMNCTRSVPAVTVALCAVEVLRREMAVTVGAMGGIGSAW